MYINHPPPNEPSPEDPGEPDVQEILGNLDKPKELFGNASLSKVTLEDCQTPSSLETDAQQDAAKPVEQSQAWADSTEDEIEEFSKAGSEKPQEAKLKEKSGMKSYCTRCRLDPHSEDECWHTIIKRATGKILC